MSIPSAVKGVVTDGTCTRQDVSAVETPQRKLVCVGSCLG
jgi:hypothetical protein